VTFSVKVRGQEGVIAAEYLCPVHGRVALDVRRDDKGDPPDLVLCPVVIDEDKAIVCGATSEWVISAPMGRAALCSFTRGKNDPPPPNAANTRELAEGMPYHEWRAKHEKRLRDIERAEWKQKTGL
jgi:hypothetical protein